MGELKRGSEYLSKLMVGAEQGGIVLVEMTRIWSQTQCSIRTLVDHGYRPVTVDRHHAVPHAQHQVPVERFR